MARPKLVHNSFMLIKYSLKPELRKYAISLSELIEQVLQKVDRDI